MNTIPNIIQSMKDSPDEMNRKRYALFLELYSHIEDLESKLIFIERIPSDRAR